MKLLRHIGGDVGEAGQSGYQPGNRIKNCRLKRGEAHFRKAYKKRFAVIYSGAVKGIDYRRKDRGGDRTSRIWVGSGSNLSTDYWYG